MSALLRVARLATLAVVVPSFAAITQAAPVYDWSGFYVGVNAGGAWTQADIPGFSTDGSAGAVGVSAGYRWALGHSVWNAVQVSDDLVTREERFPFPLDDLTVKPLNIATVSYQIGPNFPGTYPGQWFAPYVTVGGSLGTLKVGTDLGSATETKLGWTVGGGLDYRLNDNWLLHSEFTYTSFGRTDFQTSPGVTFSVKENVELLKVGVIWQPWGMARAR